MSTATAASTLSRRRFLQATAQAAGSALAATALPPLWQRALAASPVPGRLTDIEHVVILIQENRSFDHYFGTLRGVRGFDDPGMQQLSSGRPVLYQPDALNPDGHELPFLIRNANAGGQCVADLSHAWDAQHNSWHSGSMDAWLPAHGASDGGNGILTMGYYDRTDLPFHYALADAFTVCDAYHCSVFGPTNPNRLISMTGTIDPAGANGGPAVDNSQAPFSLTWTTYPEQLENAGISWKVYQAVDNDTNNVLQLFKKYEDPTSPLFQKSQLYQPTAPEGFAQDVAAGMMPQVSWILATTEECEHPSAPPIAGAAFIDQILTVLFQNPSIWAKTAMFLTWDENDGFFDHVVPPTPPPGTPGEWLTTIPLPGGASGIAGPVGLGFRVPMIVISPFARGGFVCHDTFDHSSLLRFLEARFGPEVPNLSQWRRDTCGDLTSAFNFAAPDPSIPNLPVPTAAAVAAAEQCASGANPALPSPQVRPHQEAGAARPTPSGPVPPARTPESPLGTALLAGGALAAGAAALLVRQRTATKQPQP